MISLEQVGYTLYWKYIVSYDEFWMEGAAYSSPLAIIPLLYVLLCKILSLILVGMKCSFVDF